MKTKAELDAQMEFPKGFCECGCGEKTNLAPCTRKAISQVKGEPLRYLNGHQSRGHNQGAANGRWKGGKIFNKALGRWMVSRGDGVLVGRSRVVMREHLGRNLGREEVVHHINGDKTDDRIENLQLMDLAEHTRLHNRMRKGIIENGSTLHEQGRARYV